MKTCLLHLAIAFLGAASGFANTLTTTFAGGNGRVGFMFDVAADQALTIDAFQFATFLESPAGSVEIYTKSGTHEGSEGTPAEWTLLGTVPTPPAPR